MEALKFVKYTRKIASSAHNDARGAPVSLAMSSTVISLEDTRDIIERWRSDYEFRSHSALTYLTPVEFTRKAGLEAV